MNARTARWIFFSVLLVSVASLVARSALESADLAQRLTASGEKSLAALEELYARADAVGLFQSMTAEDRKKAAGRLAELHPRKAFELGMRLYDDPDADVRQAIAESFAEVARTAPTQVAEVAAGLDPARAAALSDAIVGQPEVAARIASLTLAKRESREFGASIAARLGERGYDALLPLLGAEDGEVSLFAFESATRIDGSPPPLFARRAIEIYNASDDQTTRDRCVVALSSFPTREAKPLFLYALQDRSAPSPVRVAAARALVKLRERETLNPFRDDYDPNVREEVRGIVTDRDSEKKH